MLMLIIQLAILIAGAFIIGCISGRLIKGKKPTDRLLEDTIIAAALSTPANNDKPEPIVATKALAVEEPASQQAEAIPIAVEQLHQTAEIVELESEAPPAEELSKEDAPEQITDPNRPELFNVPLNGQSDDLAKIDGIGQSVKALLENLGVFHYSQIAQWNLDQAKWVEHQIGFAGRVTRENWVAQAVKLTETTQRSAEKKPVKSKKAATKSKSPARRKKIEG
ncbi:endonuclease [Brucella sp. 21LCYQ03]|nr:endonuclease [Brucella sp. 21LCYQ03]